MAKWRVSFLISLMVLMLAGSCFALSDLAADSPWASFFNNRTEKVCPVTGDLIVEEKVEQGQGSEFEYLTVGDKKLITKIQYPTGAYSEYSYDSEDRVKKQSLFVGPENLVVANTYHYTGSQTTIVTHDAKLQSRRRVVLTLNEGKISAKEVYDLAYSDFYSIEKWQLRDNTLEVVTRQQYLGATDAYFETTDWDQLLLSFYTPSPVLTKEQDRQVSYGENKNIANIIYTDGLERQELEKEFDGLGRLKKLSADDAVATFEYNWLGLLSKLTIEVGDNIESISYEYDALGRQILDPKARRFEVTYTYFDKKLKQIQSANGTIDYDYAEDGLSIVRTVREDNIVVGLTNYTFDPQKLELSASYGDGSSVSVQYTADGRRLLMKDSFVETQYEGQTQYEYNEYGQLTKLARGISGESFVLIHEYSPAGWLAKVTTPDGKQTEISARENILTQAKKLTSEPIWPWFN